MSAEQNISPQDYEMLSAYIDDELTELERAALEQRLARDPFLQQELNTLRTTVEVIQQLQLMEAPRDFTLTGEMISTSKVIPFKPQRRSRAPYLSLVASILLMLFGVMFMVTELSNSASLPMDKTMSQPASAAQGLDQTAVANAPTAVPVEEEMQTGGAMEAPEMADAITLDTAGEDFPEDDATLNRQAPPTDGRSGDEGSDMESFAVESSETTTDSEAPAAGSLADQESEPLADTDTNTMADETPLFDVVSEEEAPAPDISGANLRELQGMSDTTDTSDEALAGPGTDFSSTADDDASEPATSAIESRTVATATAIPPTRIPSAPSETSSAPGLNSAVVGIGFLLVGVLMLGASLIFIRRNRS